MQSTIYSSASESFLVAHIIHAGPVLEIAPEKQKNGNTHYFRLTTGQCPAYCKFKSEEAARRARGVLGAMLGTVKPHLFRSRGDSIDLSSIISFGKVVEFKNSTNDDCFGFPVTLSVIEERGKTIWITAKTEDSGINIRKALWAALMSFYQIDQQSQSSFIASENVEHAETEAVYSD